MPMYRLAFACLLIGALAGIAADQPPNIVVILADDQGWGDLSVHGNTNLATPHIDSLARDGALLERFFVCPLCAPTRAEFLSGRYHPRGGVKGVSTGEERLNPNEVTLAQVLKKAGYATGAFGKWHNGTQAPYHPNDRGFDEYYGFTSGHWGHYFSPELDHNRKMVRGDGYVSDDFTNRAIEFIKSNKSKPFLCYVPFCTPHSPMQVPDEYWNKVKVDDITLRSDGQGKEDLTFTRAALAMVENIDYNVGRLLATLDELELSQNTIVIYFSDNGPNSWRWNDEMKGRKGSLDEGGVRVPFLIRWPGRIPAGRKVNQIASAVDLLPTLAEMAGIQLQIEKPLDGRSIVGLLTGTAADWPDRTLFSYHRGQVAVRTDRFRLDPQGRLFDMQSDPSQKMNIANKHSEVVKQLTASANELKRELNAELERYHDRPFTVGYAPFTILPARDGVAHGRIKRSAGAPNCSYFTNWVAPDDHITWEIEVGTAGRYEAVVNYTAPATAVGSVVELAFNGQTVSTSIIEPHDPPAYGMEADRTDRGSESYVKDFRPLSLGVIQLPAGRGPLTLRATKQVGPQVMEVRSVTFQRVD